jgi:glycosyltransferase involved in cell wall biosynthesis
MAENMSRAKITVLVPCRNEEFHMRACLESVRWADEILMADSGSTDRTMDIGHEYGARLIEREYVNSANFKNWAIPQATHDWVLVIDSDERCMPELRDEILKELENPRCDGYRIRRRNFFLGKEIKHCGWETDELLRLFKRDYSRYEELHVHADVIVKTGSVGRLKGRFLHYTYRSFTQYLNKMNRYSTWSARELERKGRKASFWNLSTRPFFRFFKMYIIRQGFLDGKAGFLLCMLASYSVFAKYMKLWSMTEAPNLKDDPHRDP